MVTPIVGFCNCSMFCCALLCVRSSLAIILMGKRELVALLSLSSWCLVIVLWLLCGSSSWCHWFVCSLWLWYFPIILSYFLNLLGSTTWICNGNGPFGTSERPSCKIIHPSVHSRYIVNYTYILNLNVLKLCWYLLYGLKMCMYFWIVFVYFFRLVNLREIILKSNGQFSFPARPKYMYKGPRTFW